MENATLIKDNLPGFTGHAALYRLDPKHRGARHVVASSSGLVNETMVFRSNQKAEVNLSRDLEWMPNLSHASALRVMGGYEITNGGTDVYSS